MKLGQLAPYEIGDRLSYNFVKGGISKIEENNICKEFGISPAGSDYHHQLDKYIDLYRNKYRDYVPEDSTSLLKLIDAAYAKSMKQEKEAERATLDKYIKLRDIQSGFDAAA